MFILKIKSEGGMFTVFASEDVIAETLYRIRRKNPRAPGRMIADVHDRIVENIDERVTDFSPDSTFPFDDPDDAHVHAAAVACGAEYLLTADNGFHARIGTARDALPYEVCGPDEFFLLIDASAPDAVRSTVRCQLDYWCARREEVDLPHHLRLAGCPQFAERVRCHLVAMA